MSQSLTLPLVDEGLALVQAQTPGEAAVARMVEAGCTCPGLFADVKAQADYWAVTLFHPEDCPHGPISVVAVGRPMGLS